jgi:DNA modification methylase
MTPYHDKNGITLYNGDNVQVMKDCIADASIDLVVTSPPYDNLRTYGGHSWDFEGVAQQLWRVIKPGGVVVWVVADATIDGSETGTSFRQALRFMEIGFRLHDTMIYHRNGLTFPETNRYYPSFDFMFILSKNQPETTNLIADKLNKCAGQSLASDTQRNADGTVSQTSGSRKGATVKEYSIRGNVWLFDIGFMKASLDKVAYQHPATFPEALARDHILSWSNEGDTVLDPFSGSGTTAKMAKLMGRKAIGIEINEAYCEIAVERLRQGVLF